MRPALLLAVWLGCSAALALGCGSSGGPSHSTVRLSAPPAGGLADRALAAATSFVLPKGLKVEAVSDAAAADVVVSSAGKHSGPALAVRYWVPVVQLPAGARQLTKQQLGDAVRGKLTDWSSITGESLPLRVFVLQDPPAPLDQWWPGEAATVTALPFDQIQANLYADPGALALLPLDLVDARVRSLAVDGANIVFGTGDRSAYALTERAWVATHHTGDDHFDKTLDALAAELAGKLATSAPDPITLRATGDVIPSRCAYVKQRDYGDYRHAFLKLGPWLAKADLTVGSVDASMADVSPPVGCIDTFNLAAPAASVEGLAYAGYDLITNATNHAMDCGQVGACGPESMFATKANLLARGIQTVGTGTDLADARKPVVLTAKGVRFAFLGYDDIAAYYHAEPAVAGTAPLDEAYVREDVAAAKALADVVIVMPHWGVEYTSVPTDRQRTIAAAAVESGATMVIGNHPHWVQAAQVIGHSFIAYGLGNFVFDQNWSLETQQGVVMDAVFHGSQLKAIEYYPVHIYDQHQPDFAGTDEAQQIMKRIWDASAAIR